MTQEQSNVPRSGIGIALALVSLMALWSFSTLVGVASTGGEWRIAAAAGGFAIFLALLIPTILEWLQRRDAS